MMYAEDVAGDADDAQEWPDEVEYDHKTATSIHNLSDQSEQQSDMLDIIQAMSNQQFQSTHPHNQQYHH